MCVPCAWVLARTSAPLPTMRTKLVSPPIKSLLLNLRCWWHASAVHANAPGRSAKPQRRWPRLAPQRASCGCVRDAAQRRVQYDNSPSTFTSPSPSRQTQLTLRTNERRTHARTHDGAPTISNNKARSVSRNTERQRRRRRRRRQQLYKLACTRNPAPPQRHRLPRTRPSARPTPARWATESTHAKSFVAASH